MVNMELGASSDCQMDESDGKSLKGADSFLKGVYFFKVFPLNWESELVFTAVVQYVDMARLAKTHTQK